MMRVLLGVTVLLLLTGGQASASERFGSWQNLLVNAVNGVAQGFDWEMTNQALKVAGTREMNPLMRSESGRAMVKAGSVLAVLAAMGAAYKLHLVERHQVERFVPLIFAGPAVAAGIHNSGIRR